MALLMCVAPRAVFKNPEEEMFQRLLSVCRGEVSRLSNLTTVYRVAGSLRKYVLLIFLLGIPQEKRRDFSYQSFFASGFPMSALRGRYPADIQIKQ